MGQLDKKKSILENIKTWRNFAVTSIIGLIAFIFTKNDETSIFILVLSFFAFIGLGIAVFFLEKKIKKIIEEIEEL